MRHSLKTRVRFSPEPNIFSDKSLDLHSNDRILTFFWITFNYVPIWLCA